jgi:hypothetical protein
MRDSTVPGIQVLLTDFILDANPQRPNFLQVGLLNPRDAQFMRSLERF